MKNNSNNGQTVMNNTKKASRKMMQKANQKRIQAEANARRKVAKSWELVARGVKYRKAAAKESCGRLTQILEGELFDGILLNLKGRNGMKSYACQKRILRLQILIAGSEFFQLCKQCILFLLSHTMA